MKKIFNKPNTPIVLSIIAIIILVAVLCALILVFNYSSSNLAKQQQWTSGKDSFDKAYEIAASDKETPDKTLYIPKFVLLLGKSVDQALTEIGHGSVLASTEPTNDESIGAVNKNNINLSNESSSQKTGTTNVVAWSNSAGQIVKISFSCDISLLGYGKFGFVDIINNQHLVENAFIESGLYLEPGTVMTPTNKSSYTTYASDGTTAVSQVCDFSGIAYQDKNSYKWNANVNYNYNVANTKGDLSETIRILTISVSY